MLDKCPFYPSDVNPCVIKNCRFLCSGGCAIQLAAYAHDSYKGTEEIKKKIKDIEDKLRQIKNEIG